MNLTKEVAAEIFSYEAGRLTWRKPTGPRVRTGDAVGTPTSHGYTSVQVLGRSYKVHQIVYLLFHGYIAGEIDHINGCRNDNRIENLRPVNRSQNSANQRLQARSATGFKGVTLLHSRLKWRARIKVFQKEIYLGVFDTPEAAAAAYNAAAITHFGTHASLN